ncbi:hypothetical protein KM759_gp085 [Lymphocystis disease virus 4]|uniref:Uncharacterized protein n=1 Tax=Lymphocystis disease virus 4 TaxID=2704413 RepID=A0A6B9XLC9_9VIRU|nr:hypothetical protein KM759_gp085 [Lymphocystis disease virus 4]QHR78574.1 hypothetical protein [Lymphocystis disease virus 4]
MFKIDPSESPYMVTRKDQIFPKTDVNYCCNLIKTCMFLYLILLN